MLTRLALLGALVLAPLAAARAQDAAREPQIPDLAIEKYTLPNGLEVILHQDRTTPVVGVNLWYKVGSKDEKAGRTGFAHLFEHLMFQGSQNHDAEYFAPLESLGANINGSTNTDRTNYFETLPTNGLERALWLEADRMGFLLPALTQAKLDNQRDVVKNERRQRVDNVPYGMAYERMLEAMYPPEHPYHHSVIGSLADLSAASLDDVQNFFRTYYTPNNASLAITGDFDPAEAKRLVEKYFGAIPRGPEVERPRPSVPKLDAPRHVQMTDRVTLARAELSWPTVPLGHPDEPALDVLAAVLGGLDKENRLYRALQYDQSLAANVRASHPTQQLAGTFDVTITALPGQSLDDLIARADAQIERLKSEGPTADEVAKAQTTSESGLVFSLESIGGKADFLNRQNVNFGDPLAYKAEMKKLFAVNPDDVKRVANEYLGPNRVRLDVTPGAQAKRPPESEVDRKGQVAIAPERPPVKDAFDRSKMPGTGETPDFSPPPVVRRKLSNGLEVILSERHELPILTFRLILKGGQNLEPPGRDGLAELTADLMSEGTKTRDALTLAGELSKLGASVGASFDRESGSLNLTTLAKHTDPALDLFADVLLNPAFPEKELDRLRDEKLASLARRKDNAQAIAGIVFPKLLYGLDHPYGRIETMASVKSIDRDAITRFYERLFRPNNATLIIVGDTTADAIVPKLESALADWKPGPIPATPLQPAASKRPIELVLVDKPGSAQSVLYAGHIGVPRATDDYFAIEVMNAILGGQFSSRLNLNLREAKGYTYGARTGFTYRQGPGPFVAATSVQTAVTKEALTELVKELTDITGPRPATQSEFDFARGNLIKSFPGDWGTTRGVSSQLSELAQFGLPDDYFTSYQARLEAVTLDDVNRVARKYVRPDNLLIVVVGDRDKIEAGLRELPFGKSIRVVGPEGEPIEEKTPAAAGR
jgi:zinc protease